MTIRTEVRDRVGYVVLDRPESLNTLDARSRVELIEAWQWIEQTAKIRVAVLTGAGDRSFCAGSDLKDTALDQFDVLSDEFFGDPPRPHFARLLDGTKPVIAAINGYALGGGLELAFAADIRIASTTATFGMPEVAVGSMPGGGASQYLPREIGVSNAMYLLLSGSRIDAQTALRMGLISECVAPEELLARAHEIATRIADNAPLSVRATRQAVRAGLDLPLDRGLDYERSLFALIRASADRAEGRAAFREKRPPDYHGR